MTNPIQFDGVEEGDDNLHFEGTDEAYDKALDEVADLIVSKVAANREGIVCGGCLNGFVVNVADVLAKRGNMSKRQRVENLRFLARSFLKEADAVDAGYRG